MIVRRSQSRRNDVVHSTGIGLGDPERIEVGASAVPVVPVVRSGVRSRASSSV
jgi:hypothetical protein